MDARTLEEKLSHIEGGSLVREEIVAAIHQKNIDRVEEVLDVIANAKSISRASSALLLKSSLDTVEKEGRGQIDCVRVYDRMIKWAESNRRNLLKLDFKMRKAENLLAQKHYKECLELIAETAKVLKQADDKIGLVKLYYLESKVYYELKNLPRAKSSLTLSRSTSTFVYCPSHLQAKMDLLNGVYLADERDYNTAVSYIMEALEGFSLAQDAKMGVQCARYLILMKIMENKVRDAKVLLSHKLVAPHKKDQCIEMLGVIAACVGDRNLRECNDIIQKNLDTISQDRFLVSHLMFLCDNLIDSNILKIIEPYSNISVEYIGHTLGFDTPTIENRLRRMILDRRIIGTIDQETMCLNISTPLQTCRRAHGEVSEILSVLSDATQSISNAK
ncbi:26S proteasome regulatory subunit N6 [Nematocida sp. AWRm77]|nr:26S proteasome regulatory subunit N6 [Nematocida sp. AWRm77]